MGYEFDVMSRNSPMGLETHIERAYMEPLRDACCNGPFKNTPGKERALVYFTAWGLYAVHWVLYQAVAIKRGRRGIHKLQPVLNRSAVFDFNLALISRRDNISGYPVV